MTQFFRACLFAGISLGACLTIHAQELTVSAAASLTNAFQSLAQAFEKTHPGSKIILNFAASGALLQQIRHGAPVDVFAAADQETMARAAAENLLSPATRADFTANQLVLVLPIQSALRPKSLRDLTGAQFRRIAIGNPATVPVGRYAMHAVESSGVRAALEPKWIYAENVRQVLNYVVRAEVDAGFIYQTDALLEKDKVRVAFSIPTSIPITYPIAQIATTKNPALAQEFIRFVRSADGQTILAGFGFSKP